VSALYRSLERFERRRSSIGAMMETDLVQADPEALDRLQKTDQQLALAQRALRVANEL
jgi:hypothetical protein